MKKAVIACILVVLFIVPQTGCIYGYSEDDIWGMIDDWLADYETNQEESEDVAEAADLEGLSLRLTFPAGYSPNVFMEGWLFGASCTYQGEDISDQVKWSGTGKFNPDTGVRSRPIFEALGANTIIITVTIESKAYQQSYNVNAVNQMLYAAVGTNAQCDAYARGCPACPHSVNGPITTGSTTVYVGGSPAARVGDHGIVAGGCGDCYFVITSGDPSVLIDGRPAAKRNLAVIDVGGTKGYIP